MKRLLLISLFILLCANAWGTTTVTGTMQSLGGSNVTGGFVRFWLRGCAGNQPRVAGSGLIAPTLGGVYYFDFAASGSGVISGTLYSNRDSTGLLGGDIECGGSLTATWYGMQAFFGGKGGPEVAVYAKNGASLDISNVTPITTNPVIAAPTGDSTYLRLDGGNSPVSGPVTFAAAVTNTKLNRVYYVDGTTYPVTSAGISAALTAACNGTIPGKVVLSPTGLGTIITGFSAQITVPSNCTIQGPGKYLLTLQVSGSYSTNPFFLLSGATNVSISGFGLDGDAPTNANAVDGIDVTNSSKVTISDMLISNFGNSEGISLNAGSTYITIADSDLSRNGPALPTAGGGGLAIQPGTGVVSHIKVLRNLFHDGSFGVQSFNSSISTNVSEDWVFAENSFYANALSGLNLNTLSALGGPVFGFRAENNDSYCNGWPANGTGFPAACTAGYRQSGSNQSPTGVGIELIGNLVQQDVEIGNRVHDNTYDGISHDNHMTAVVTVSGATVTWVSGPKFPLWRPNTFLNVNGTSCQVSSNTATSITLTASCGSSGNLLGPTYVNAVVGNNIATHNGNPLTGGTGILSYYSDGNSFDDDVYKLNNLEGFGCIGSNLTTVTGGVADANDQNNLGGSNAGFLTNLCNNTIFTGIAAYDAQSFVTQVNGVLNQGSFNTTVVTGGLASYPLANQISDSGTGTIYNGHFLGTPWFSAIDGNLDDNPTFWTNCATIVCAGGSVNGTATQTFATASPSHDGNSSQINCGAVSGVNCLFVNKPRVNDTATKFQTDAWVYIPSLTSIGQLEQDTFQALTIGAAVREFMWGTQCNFVSGFWQLWNQGAGTWNNTTITCTSGNWAAATWHHYVLNVHRVPGDVSCGGPCQYFDTLQLDDGAVNVLNVAYPTSNAPGGWTHTIGTQFQIDITGSVTAIENLDQINLTVGN